MIFSNEPIFGPEQFFLRLQRHKVQQPPANKPGLPLFRTYVEHSNSADYAALFNGLA